MTDYPGADFDAAARALLAPDDYENPEPAGRYHLIVIGAGPAGLISAIGAAGVGARVALIERGLMGGDCLNVGCVPSKALLEYTARTTAPAFGDAFRWLREVRAGIAPHDSVARYNELGADVFLGEARFVDAHTVAVGDTQLTGRRIAICVGARAAVPPIPGLVESSPLTNETVFDLTEAPDSVAILGAGPIGCELATVFARLGVTVHLFEMADRILPLETLAASERLADALRALGVTLHVGDAVQEVVPGEPVQVKSAQGIVSVERIVVALGRSPNTDSLQTENAGVTLDPRGFVVTDAKLRTSAKHIYAAGDCRGGLQFTHHADAQARVVVQNALFAMTARVDGLVVPHCTYTHPEIASVGAREEDLDAANQPYDVYEVSFDELDRGRAELDGTGFARVLTAKGKDKILGATIVGHDAGEQLAPLCLLMSNGLGLGAAGKALYSYPTRSEYLKNLANAYTRSRFTPTVAALFKNWLRLTG